MNWLSLISGLVKLGNLLAGWFRDKQIEQTGRDLERGQSASETLESLDRVRRFRDGNLSDIARDRLRQELERDEDVT